MKYVPEVLIPYSSYSLHERSVCIFDNSSKCCSLSSTDLSGVVVVSGGFTVVVLMTVVVCAVVGSAVVGLAVVGLRVVGFTVVGSRVVGSAGELEMMSWSFRNDKILRPCPIKVITRHFR